MIHDLDIAVTNIKDMNIMILKLVYQDYLNTKCNMSHAII